MRRRPPPLRRTAIPLTGGTTPKPVPKTTILGMPEFIFRGDRSRWAVEGSPEEAEMKARVPSSGIHHWNRRWFNELGFHIQRQAIRLSGIRPQ